MFNGLEFLVGFSITLPVATVNARDPTAKRGGCAKILFGVEFGSLACASRPVRVDFNAQGHEPATHLTKAPTVNYIEQALITKSNEFHGDLMPRDELLRIIGSAIVALNRLDAVKKTLFYGRDFPTNETAFVNSRSVAKDWEIPQREGDSVVLSEHRAVDVIHAILGKATECGELLELLNETIQRKEFDPVNFGEEMFDSQWYDAIGCNAIGMTFEQGQAQNIAKLKKRFGDKFTAWYANNRDLVAERQTLEFHDNIKLSKPLNLEPRDLDKFRTDPIG